MPAISLKRAPGEIIITGDRPAIRLLKVYNTFDSLREYLERHFASISNVRIFDAEISIGEINWALKLERELQGFMYDDPAKYEPINRIVRENKRKVTFFLTFEQTVRMLLRCISDGLDPEDVLSDVSYVDESSYELGDAAPTITVKVSDPIANGLSDVLYEAISQAQQFEENGETDTPF